ncbi:MAG: hypothetical protein EXR55_02580 [Dehalococcoidia bacterium]|nr:hypothetical protein [Dehalococcoidia bacterium]
MQRLLLPVLVPLGALLATVTIVFSVGLLLLWVGDYRWNGEPVGPVDFVRLAVGGYERSEVHGGDHVWDLGLFTMGAPVIVALVVATAILAGAIVAARRGRSQG